MEVYLHFDDEDKNSFSPNLLKMVWTASNNVLAVDYVTDLRKSFYVEPFSFTEFKSHLNSIYDKNFKEDKDLKTKKEFKEFEKRWY